VTLLDVIDNFIHFGAIQNLKLEFNMPLNKVQVILEVVLTTTCLTDTNKYKQYIGKHTHLINQCKQQKYTAPDERFKLAL